MGDIRNLTGMGKGRKLGSKNKKITAAKITQEFRELANADNAQGKLYAFLMGLIANEDVRPSEKIKAAEQVLKRLVAGADVDNLIEAKPAITSPEEALAILSGTSYTSDNTQADDEQCD